MRPIHPKCGVLMRCQQNDARVLLSGGCGEQVIVGFGARPVAEHFHAHFAECAAAPDFTISSDD